MSDPKAVHIFIPGELEYLIANNLACLRFHYRFPENVKPPEAGDLFTGLTVEQAEDTIRFLAGYVQRMRLAGVMVICGVWGFGEGGVSC